MVAGHRPVWGSVVAFSFCIVALAEIKLPPRFFAERLATGLANATTLEFLPDGRAYVAINAGIVYLIEDGELAPTPVIDLTNDVAGRGQRGLLGMALDPDFEITGYVYLLYGADPDGVEPDLPARTATFGRLVRYTASAAANLSTLDPSSRVVLIGQTPSSGIPICDYTHAVGELEFGPDGMLFVSTGDGSPFAEAGGITPTCFGPGMFGSDQDIGAFRAQYLDSPAGKVLRIDPSTGLGLPDNPYFTGNPDDARSRVWAYGLRNPFRFCVQPGSTGAGTLWIGDVGDGQHEELSRCLGGENFGWPCREAFMTTAHATSMHPAHHGCETLQSPTNPGPLTPPVISWSHFSQQLSSPPGYIGSAVSGCGFYTHACYPPEFREKLYYGDFTGRWIKALQLDASGNSLGVAAFGDALGLVVDVKVDPLTGDVHYVDYLSGSVFRLRYSWGDVNDDGRVDLTDLSRQISNFGEVEPGLDGDTDLDGDVDLRDLSQLLSRFGDVCFTRP
ncbi:MAG: PQQ-dependent sugar dehydrogenase [Phycisphaerae bacterium]